LKTTILRLLATPAAKVAVLGALLVVLLGQINVASIASHFHRDMLVAIALVQPIVIVGVGINALRFAILVGQPRITLATAFKAQVLSLGLNIVLPARASEFLKATYIRTHARIPLGQGVAAVFLERIVDLLLVGALTAIGVSLLLAQSYVLAASLIFVGIAALLGFAIFEAPLLRLARLLPWARLRGFSLRFIDHISVCVRGRSFYLALPIGALVWASACMTFVVFLAVAGSIPVGLGGAIVVFVAATVGGAVPALPGGIGTYEAAVAISLKSLGYSLEEGIALGIAIHASQLLFCVTGAAAIAALERTGLRDVVRSAMLLRPNAVPLSQLEAQDAAAAGNVPQAKEQHDAASNSR
jgi:uncharacterized membrane protein YbhN (UPF0104 family)